MHGKARIASTSERPSLNPFAIHNRLESNHESPRSRRIIAEPSVVPVQGWHCGHYFYRWNREVLRLLGKTDSSMKGDFSQGAPRGGHSTAREVQSFIVSGHKRISRWS